MAGSGSGIPNDSAEKPWREKAKEILRLLEAWESLDYKGLRESLGLSQERAARICDVSLRTWCRWEYHERRPESFEPIQKLCLYIIAESKK